MYCRNECYSNLKLVEDTIFNKKVRYNEKKNFDIFNAPLGFELGP